MEFVEHFAVLVDDEHGATEVFQLVQTVRDHGDQTTCRGTVVVRLVIHINPVQLERTVGPFVHLSIKRLSDRAHEILVVVALSHGIVVGALHRRLIFIIIVRVDEVVIRRLSLRLAVLQYRLRSPAALQGRR